MSTDTFDRIIGIDVSTTTTAFTILDTDGRLLHIEHISLSDAHLLERATTVRLALQRAIQEHPGAYKAYIESPAMMYGGNATTANTIALLQQFNGIVSYIAYELTGVLPAHVAPSTARAACGIKIKHEKSDTTAQRKKVTKDAVIAHTLTKHSIQDLGYETKRTGNWKDWCGDRADSYVIAEFALRSLVK